MNFLQFCSKKPILYGNITVNGNTKFGMFKAEYNKYSDNIDYSYYTLKGNKGTGGFTMHRAYNLFNSNKLSLSKDDWVL